MKVLVAVKRVVDYQATVRVNAEGTAVETANTKMSMNPFDEIALEEALRMKEKAIATEVIALSIGADACQETLRTALAMGADRAVFVKSDHALLPLTVAKIIRTLAQQETIGFILLGKQAIDTDDNQVGQMVAGLLNWPQGTFASKLDFHDGGVSVTREIDGGLETLFLQLPAVVTTDLRLNEPRYISLPNIVQAKRKTITTIAVDSFSLDLNQPIQLLKVATPDKRHAGVQVDNPAELVQRLKQEAKVLG